MPMVLRLRCEGCGDQQAMSESRTVVLMDDGSEQLCPHPAERSVAEELTGETWSDLVKAGRIQYRYSCICGNCGAAGYYANELAPTRSFFGHIRAITWRPSPQQASVLPCSACGLKKLTPLSRVPSGSIFACPRCGQKTVQISFQGIS